MVKFEHSNKNQNSVKIVFVTSLTASQHLDFSGFISADTNECDFYRLYREMCQHLKEWYNSVNQCFPNEQCILDM